MKVNKAKIKQMVAEAVEELVQEFMPREGEVPPGDRLEPTPSLEEVAKTLEEAAKLLITGRVLQALHHGGEREGSPLYERANTVFNELLNIRDELRDRK